MTVTLRGVGIILGVVILAFLAVYVWPTAWSYPEGNMVMGNQVLPIAMRVNRFTGRAEALTVEGWKAAEVAPAAAARPAGLPAQPTG